jgi:hypothetical protein
MLGFAAAAEQAHLGLWMAPFDWLKGLKGLGDCQRKQILEHHEKRLNPSVSNRDWYQIIMACGMLAKYLHDHKNYKRAMEVALACGEAVLGTANGMNTGIIQRLKDSSAATIARNWCRSSARFPRNPNTTGSQNVPKWWLLSSHPPVSPNRFSDRNALGTASRCSAASVRGSPSTTTARMLFAFPSAAKSRLPCITSHDIWTT